MPISRNISHVKVFMSYYDSLNESEIPTKEDSNEHYYFPFFPFCFSFTLPQNEMSQT